MSRVVLTEHAAQDLQAIGDYVAQDSLQASDAVIDYLIEQLAALAKTPTIGRERSDLWPGVLCFGTGKSRWRSRFMIFYRKIKGGIEVARIIEGHRHIQMALDHAPSDAN